MSNILGNKKIAFVINTLQYGGAGKMVKFVATTCVPYFSEVTVITLFDKKKQNDGNIFNSIDLEFDYKNKMWRVNAIRKIRHILSIMKYDCVCAFVSDVAVLSRIASIGMNITFFSAERGDPYSMSIIWSLLTKCTYGLSDRCFFQLEKARDYYGKLISKKSFVIPNPYIGRVYCDISKIRKKTIVSAGRFEWQKGYDILISAFSIFVKKFPDYELTIYGDGSLYQDYIIQVQELGISDKVHFPGYVENVAEAIKDDGIFVLPSRFEGIPNSLIEAMATGIPTISTDCSPGGPRFLTDNGRRGILVGIDDVVGLSEALEKYASDPNQACKVGFLGLEVVKLLEKELIQTQWIEAFKVGMS